MAGDDDKPAGGGDAPPERPKSAAETFGRVVSSRQVERGDAQAERPVERPVPEAPQIRRPSFAAIKPPAVELPKGGGAIRGLGETYRTNPATGTASADIPLPVTQLSRGPLPDLALRYDSGGGQGIFGIGWSLSLPSIRRRTDRGVPRYRDTGPEPDPLMGAEGELVPKLDLVGSDWVPDVVEGNPRIDRYRARSEGSFSIIERLRSAPDSPADPPTAEVSFRTLSRDNVTVTYGTTTQSRLSDPANGRRIAAWLVDRIEDDRGNVVTFEYDTPTSDEVSPHVFDKARRSGLAPHTNRYPKRIRYGNAAPGDAASWTVEVVFDYGDKDPDDPAWSASEVALREDPFSDHRLGFDVRTYRLCRRVLVYHRFAELGERPVLVRMLELAYSSDTERPAGQLPWLNTRLISARLVAFGRNLAGDAAERIELPATIFDYSPITQDKVAHPIDEDSQRDLPAHALTKDAQWVDLDGDGLPGVLTNHGFAISYKRNLGGGRLLPQRRLAEQPAMAALGGDATQLTDVEGTGELSLLSWGGPTPGFHPRISDEGWGPFHAFTALPNAPFDDPQSKLVDLDGDGLDDLIVARGDHLLYFRAKGREGFEPPLRVPLLGDESQAPQFVFGNRHRSVFFADMSGDGLADLVVVSHSRVAYWPALGHGRFGALITMEGIGMLDRADTFDGGRLRLADLDGTGPADLVYFGVDATHVYRNQGGNRFAERVALDIPWRAVETAATIDLLGKGTTSIVFALPNVSNAPLRYVDFQQGKKPHLLTQIDNGFGRIVRFEYASSTESAMSDRKAGRPWVTKLPFPVQVVQKMHVYDLIRRARTVTEYRYHHGYYDGEEREFAGFAFVEQEDAQSFDATTGKGLIPLQVPPPDGWPDASHEEIFSPPSLTKIWFHTGAWTGRHALEEKLARDFWRGYAAAPPQPGISLPRTVGKPSAGPMNPDAGGFDRREAVRSLRGAPLRREVYGLDGDASRASVPYLVETHGYEVRCLQPVVGSATRPRDRIPGVALRIDLESVHAVYDRASSDPRLIQALVLETDDYGTVTRDAVVAYPRRGAAPEPEQRIRHIAVSERDMLHLDAGTAERRLAIPIAERLWELTDAAESGWFTRSALNEAFQSATAIAYHDVPSAGIPQRRLLEHTKVRYYDSSALPVALAFGQADARSLPYESYRLDLTPGVLAVAGLSADIAPSILAEGGYVTLPGEIGHWAPSGRALPDPLKFYQSTMIWDPRGREVSLQYDASSLFVVEVRDPLANVVKASVDYRALIYREITDPNGNRREVRFDALGRITHLAAKGKIGDSDGDTIEDPTEAYQYDAMRWRTAQKPAFARSLLRETHGPANNRFLESYAYSDGGGALVMIKQKVEPASDGAPRWVGNGRTVLDNKGQPVKQYEPYFSETHEYEDEDELVARGVSPLITYDPVGRVTRVDHPDGSFETFERDPWKEVAFDKNDNQAGGPHENTPTVSHLDPLGRPFLVDLDNGDRGHIRTRVEMDLEGAVVAVRDALDRVCASFVYAMGGQLLKETSIDAGVHRSFVNVTGSVIRRWDDGAPSRVHRFEYDELERPTHRYCAFGAEPEMVLQRLYYGEATSAPEVRNLRGQLVLHYDAAGQTESVQFDFQGRLLESRRRLAASYRAEPDWSSLAAIAAPAVAVTAAAIGLESESFTEKSSFDALGRPTSMTSPDASEIRPTYNEAGLLEGVDARIRGALEWTRFVEGIDYDEKGRRQRIAFGNGTTTEYRYDPLTFRLTRLLTTRASGAVVLQNLAYTYDPVGNILAIADTSDREPIFANAVASPSATYRYDAAYRLIHATGREHAGGVADVPRGHDDLPLRPLPHPNDPTAVRLYEEDYVYDLVGNILELAHTAVGNSSASWTRRHAYAPGTNRLGSTNLPGDTPGVVPYSARYAHDEHGNLTSMPHLARMEYDHADRMREADLGGGGNAFYVYRADGSRARKVIERIGTLIEERIYLGGWELYRRRDQTGVLLERETLHIMDDQRRIAMVETKTIDASVPAFTPAPRLRFQLDDHIWSGRLELDETGLVISYEEFHPYGTSAYRSARSGVEVSERRFRYTGKERDDETGFQIHGLRYYCPWLGRWTTSDPIGLKGGLNGFGYCRGDPVGKVDPRGTVDAKPGSSDYEIMQRTDQQLIDHLQSLSAVERGNLLQGATGRFQQRAEAARGLVGLDASYTLDEVEVMGESAELQAANESARIASLGQQLIKETADVRLPSNIEIVGDDDYRQKVGTDLRILSGVPTTGFLIQQIGEAGLPLRLEHPSPNMNINVTGPYDPNTSSAYRPGRPIGALINYMPDVGTVQFGDGGELYSISPQEALAHELVHAYHLSRGTAPEMTEFDPADPKTELFEAQAMGTGSFEGSFPTQNSFRLDVGLEPPRLNHSGLPLAKKLALDLPPPMNFRGGASW